MKPDPGLWPHFQADNKIVFFFEHHSEIEKTNSTEPSLVLKIKLKNKFKLQHVAQAPNG